MGLRDRFASQYARQKTMTGPEKKANEVITKILMKKALIFIVAMLVVSIAGGFLKAPWWAILIADILVIAAMVLYMRREGKKLQTFQPYVGTLISIDKKSNNEYQALIKQGKKPLKLDIKYGGEDLLRVKKNALVQISYNPEAKIAVLVKR